MFRWLFGLLLLLALAATGAYVAAGRGAPPRVTIDKPDRVVGQSGTLEVTVDAPGARLSALTIALEQNGRTTPPSRRSIPGVCASRVRSEKSPFRRCRPAPGGSSCRRRVRRFSGSRPC